MKPLIALAIMAAAIMGCQAPDPPAAEDMIDRHRAELQAATEELRAAAGILSNGADAALVGELAPPVMAAEPTPAPTATVAPTPTAYPTPTPAPTRPAGDTGICYRTPEVQRWIIQRLQIHSCRLITEPELYRITDGMSGRFKPGDLAGLANVPKVAISGYCGDWTDAEYAAAVLDGLNPDAVLTIEVDIPYPAGEWPRNEIIQYGITGDWQTAFSIGNRERGWSEEQIEPLYQRGVALKQEINTRARAVAEAISTARDGKSGLIRLKTNGQAVVGDPPEPGSVSVGVYVRWQPHTDMPECD